VWVVESSSARAYWHAHTSLLYTSTSVTGWAQRAGNGGLVICPRSACTWSNDLVCNSGIQLVRIIVARVFMRVRPSLCTSVKMIELPRTLDRSHPLAPAPNHYSNDEFNVSVRPAAARTIHTILYCYN
jgi:hypothetical protein